jgi:hypothetical protein
LSRQQFSVLHGQSMLWGVEGIEEDGMVDRSDTPTTSEHER